MKILICDDEYTNLEIFKKYILKTATGHICTLLVLKILKDPFVLS